MLREWVKVDSILHNLCKSKYQRGANEPGVAMDCKSLFVEAMKVFGNDVKVADIEIYAIEQIIAAQARGEYAYTDIDSSMIEDELKSGKWEKLDEPIAGCAVTMALDSMKPELVQHLGVYIGDGKFIHILEDIGVVISRTDDRFFRRKIKGFYKWLG